MSIVHYFQKLYELFNYEDLLLVFLSILIGLVIGAEREYKNKAAGLRTLMLVSVGSCTFTILSIKVGINNPDRIAANIITGIGFLGAGAIFKDDNKINGITTACTIWVTAALGMCIGSGHIYLGILSTVVVLFVLFSLVSLERWIDKKNDVKLYKITIMYEENKIDYFETLFSEFCLKGYSTSQVREGQQLTVKWKMSGNKKDHDRIAKQLFADTSILKIEI